MTSRYSYSKRVKAGLCAQCGKEREPRPPEGQNRSAVNCLACADYARAYARMETARKRVWWRFNGDCIFCSGKRKAMVTIDPVTKAKKVLKWCAVCAEKHTERQRTKRQALKKLGIKRKGKRKK